MTIDEPVRNNTATSDFEEFKKFFELMGIKYEIPADNLIYLSGFEVNSSQLIVIKFYENGGFQEFCPYPEAFTHTECLTELKDLREENKVLTSECDRLIKEKGDLLSKISGGEICQLEEQIKDWKEEYAYLNKISYGFYKELKEAKLLLKKAIDDFKELDKDKLNGKCMMPSMDCACCPLNWDSVDDKAEPCHNWRYTNEALKIIGEANGEEREDNK